MTRPMPVEIVRPRRSGAERFGALVGRLGEFFLAALIVMWLAPGVIAWHPGYWQCLALIVAVRAIATPGSADLIDRITRSPDRKP